MIIDIEGNSREDGPGVRSVVFFKGCLLNCLWCQNPESKKSGPELWWDEDKCDTCGECIPACPRNAIAEANPDFIDRESCDLCFKCEAACPQGALRHVGSPMSVDDIVRKVVRYRPFYETSGGGVTLSGGEPSLYMDFVSELLQALKAENIHTLVETAGQFDFDHFASAILPHTDMIYFDIKLIDAAEHKRLCGVDNETILKNFIKLHEASGSGDFEVIPRTPLIPGMTDLDAHIESLGTFYQQQRVKKACLLPNNPAWTTKLARIGQIDPFAHDAPLRSFYDEGAEEKVMQRLSSYGIDISLGRMDNRKV